MLTDSLHKCALYLAAACIAMLSGVVCAEDQNGWSAETIPADISPTIGPEQGPGFAQPAFIDRLTLREAVSRTLAHHPAIVSALREVDARDGEAYQAGRLPNPELLLEVENFAGNKDKSNFDAAEQTASITQLIELGSKRYLRLQAANLETSLASWDLETVRVQVATQAAQLFIDVMTAQSRVKVLGDFVGIAEKTRKSVDARVKAGKASPIELDRAIVAAARAKALEKAEHARLKAVRQRLATLWGSRVVDFKTASGRLGNGHVVPSLEQLENHLNNNPMLARWTDEIGRRAAQLDLEHAKRIPDIRLGAGVRQFNDNDSTAMVASIGIPLPIFDRNSGNIDAAASRLAKAESDAVAQRIQLTDALVEARGELDVAATQMNALERDVLPVAETAFDRTKLGYDEGKFDLLNVLDVQRSVFEVRLDLLNARAEYEKARVKVEALIGRDISEF